MENAKRAEPPRAGPDRAAGDQLDGHGDVSRVGLVQDVDFRARAAVLRCGARTKQQSRDVVPHENHIFFDEIHILL